MSGYVTYDVGSRLGNEYRVHVAVLRKGFAGGWYRAGRVVRGVVAGVAGGGVVNESLRRGSVAVDVS